MDAKYLGCPPSIQYDKLDKILELMYKIRVYILSRRFSDKKMIITCSISLWLL